MIKLIKGPTPSILQLNAGQWTAAAMSFFNAGQPIPDNIINKYNQPAVKAALVDETKAKCAYCESKILHIDYGDIEHIIPKRKHPITAFEWDNLTLACGVCNNNKGDYFAQSSLLLNPYIDDIYNHLLSGTILIMHVNGSIKGEFTHKLLQLNRSALVERRREAIDGLQNLIDKYHRESILILKDIYKDEIIDMVKPDKEHSFTLRSYAIAQNLQFIR
jgi:uncharacterized protein (TIGR02646 family)